MFPVIASAHRAIAWRLNRMSAWLYETSVPMVPPTFSAPTVALAALSERLRYWTTTPPLG